MTIRELRAFIREQSTTSITGYPYADNRDVTSQNNDVMTIRSIEKEQPEGDWTTLGDEFDIFEDDTGLGQDDEDGDHRAYDPIVPMMDPFVRDATRRS